PISKDGTLLPGGIYYLGLPPGGDGENQKKGLR
ncbi:unnamed protein product, partial [marine sediment metagenome]